MFIYKITNTKNERCYIGLDTKPEERQARWNVHLSECKNGGSKFYNALRKDIGGFAYEVIDRADNIVDLAILEIKWIEYYDSYKYGYNSSLGGDGLNQDLTTITEAEYRAVKEALSKSRTERNHNELWAGTTKEERKEMCSHLHTPEIYKKRSKSLKEFYERNPAAKEAKGEAIKAYIDGLSPAEREQRRQQLIKNSMKGAAKSSKGVKVITPDGEEKTYSSKSEFTREHGHIINRAIKKTQQGTDHKGWKAWEI